MCHIHVGNTISGSLKDTYRQMSLGVSLRPELAEMWGPNHLQPELTDMCIYIHTFIHIYTGYMSKNNANKDITTIQYY